MRGIYACTSMWFSLFTKALRGRDIHIVGTRRAAFGLNSDALPSMALRRFIDILLWVYVDMVPVGPFLTESAVLRPIRNKPYINYNIDQCKLVAIHSPILSNTECHTRFLNTNIKNTETPSRTLNESLIAQKNIFL